MAVPASGWGISSSATTEPNYTNLNRKWARYRLIEFDETSKYPSPRHLVSTLVCRGPWMSTLLLVPQWQCISSFVFYIDEYWQETISQRPLPTLCFSNRLENQDGRGIFDFSANRGKEFDEVWRIFFRADQEANMAALASGWRKHSRLLLWSRCMESAKLYSRKDTNVLYKVCVFRAGRKTKMAFLASHWLKHFRLLPSNHWTEFNLKGNEYSASSIPSSYFSELSQHDPSLQPRNSWRNLTGIKISTSSTKFMFIGPIGKLIKLIWPSWPLIV